MKLTKEQNGLILKAAKNKFHQDVKRANHKIFKDNIFAGNNTSNP